MIKAKSQRLAWRSSFFLLFFVAPPLDLFRFDLIQNYFFVLGFPWIRGIAELQTGDISAMQMTWNMLLRFFLLLGLIVGVGVGVYVSWKWGRLS
jgi:ferredoxin-type protein NapH